MVETITWQQAAIYVSVAMFVFGVLFQTIGYFARQIIISVHRRFDEMVTRMDAEALRVSGIERELLDLRARLPEQYVRREDWVRVQAVTDARYDAINARLASIQGAQEAKQGARA